MIRLIHTADLHLDSPFAALAPEQAAQRRAEQRELLDRLAEECLRLRCDLLLLAGDLFDGTRIYRQTVEALQAALARCGARVFIAPGNHDCLGPTSPYLTLPWPENVHIFTRDAVSCVTLPELGCRVYGAGFRAARTPGLLEGFRAPQDGLCSLMVLHADPTDPDSDHCPVTREQIRASGLDYLALGHVHARAAGRVGGTFTVMPGCPMGRGFDETGVKGVYYVELTKEGCDARFLPLGARRYETLRVEAGADPLASILAALPEDTARDVYRITLTGETEAPDLSALREALRRRFYALTLEDRTRPPRSVWSGAGENSLRGELLRRLKARCDAADEAQRQTVLQAARLCLALMDGREVTL